MNKEELFLIDIAKAYFFDSRVDIPADIDYNALYKLLINHNLIGIAYCVLNKSDAPESVIKVLSERFYKLVYTYECQSNALAQIDEAMAKAGIQYVLFKGSVLRELYPVPESRAMNDIDFLVSEADRDKAKQVLEGIGYNCFRSNGPVYEYSSYNIKLEVHTKLIREFGDDAFCDAFENAEFVGFKGKLDDSYHFAYLIAHIAHHFKFYGAGAKLILDLAVMLNKCDIDIDKVLDILTAIKLDKFCKVILSVCCKWFGVGSDFGVDTIKTEEYLLKCGAFGSLNDNKGAIIARKDLEKGKRISSGFLVKLRLAFPSYSTLRDIPYIKFLNGRPWLLPLAWIYRFFYNLKNKKGFMLSAVKSLDDDNTQALAREELAYFEEIGLV